MLIKDLVNLKPSRLRRLRFNPRALSFDEAPPVAWRESLRSPVIKIDSLIVAILRR